MAYLHENKNIMIYIIKMMLINIGTFLIYLIKK